MRMTNVRVILGLGLILCAISSWAAEPAGFKGVVTKLDAQNRVVGVKEDATGKLWELTLGASDALSELKIGQQVLVDLKAKTLTLAKNKFAIATVTEAPQRKEFQSLQKKLEALTPESSEWDKLVKDFDAWAKKYAAKVESQSQAATSEGGPKKWKKCKPIFEPGPHIYCVLDSKSSGGGVCRYKCYWY